ncbi:MAG: GNAT family N-acetyltransferase, partial [Boseongicola sp.]|nr:GNAT family N-acetyltransferase [Boseongicola sp.]
FGKALVLFALDELRRQGASRAMLGAQTSATGFYEVLGFAAIGPEFIDAGIPHREMVLEL